MKIKILPLIFAIFALAGVASAACSNSSAGNGFVCIQSCQDGGTGANPGCSLGTATVSGHLLVVTLSIADSTTTMSAIIDGCGDTLAPTTHSPERGTGNSAFINWAVTSGGCGSIGITLSTSATYSFQAAEYSGTSGTPFDCDAVGTGNGTALATATCATQVGSKNASMTAGTSGQWSMLMAAFKGSSGTKDLLIGMGGGGVSSVTFTAGSGFTIREQQAGTGHSAAMEDASFSSGGATIVQRRR